MSMVKQLCLLTFTLISFTNADIYDNCDQAGINCIVQNKGNGPGPSRGSDDCHAEKVCSFSPFCFKNLIFGNFG